MDEKVKPKLIDCQKHFVTISTYQLILWWHTKATPDTYLVFPGVFESMNPILKSELQGSFYLWCFGHSSWRGGRQSRSNTRNLRRHWWEGPMDLSVDEGPWHWECLPPKETRSHYGYAISYEYLMASGFLNAQEHLYRRCELGYIIIWVGRYIGTTTI